MSSSMLRFWARILSFGALLLLAVSVGSPPAYAQSLSVASPDSSSSGTSPFTPCLSATSGNATIIFPQTTRVVVDDEALRPGDEIAAVDANGKCVGRLTWSDTQSEALTVWEAGLFRTPSAGLHPGDPIALYIWRHASKRLHTPKNSTLTVQLDASAPYLHDTLRYQRNGMYVVEQLTVRSGL